MNTIVLLSDDAELIAELRQAFAQVSPELRVVEAHEAAAATAEVAACWFPPAGSWQSLPRLRLIHSMSAGIEHIGQADSLPAVPVCRVVDPEQRQGMVEFMRWAVIHYQRHFDLVLANQQQARWQRPPQCPARDYRVGVLGLGSMGSAVAQDLAGAGYAVRGWSRSPKTLAGVDCHHGDHGLQDCLAGLDLLINLLPLTAATTGLLDRRAFAALARGAVLVNGGRGQHVAEADLHAALASGQLRAALLDVFEQEPLPAAHPWWHTPGVTVTPHMASAASARCIASQIAENTRRLASGAELLHRADPALGY
ncbi:MULTISPECIES: 2-hydroxyacid dehydrogenase [Aquitalea]|uniref:Glyoxylate/hydroxypyruvate reductase A n=1 Tax=Aquitalea magnusonii TaxID=332411 RepID=A0A318JNW6_9NEIS|nr:MULTISPECIES: glyoxylate/hydroxypyruvate reductase A [Aquitalea]PXX50100.1 glyoxylate/hydroxypyruvate reductase A [Aquitalea magnusonii]